MNNLNHTISSLAAEYSIEYRLMLKWIEPIEDYLSKENNTRIYSPEDVVKIRKHIGLPHYDLVDVVKVNTYRKIANHLSISHNTLYKALKKVGKHLPRNGYEYLTPIEIVTIIKYMNNL